MELGMALLAIILQSVAKWLFLIPVTLGSGGLEALYLKETMLLQVKKILILLLTTAIQSRISEPTDSECANIVA